ncbi:putative fluoride ion transporter CrcB [Pseudobythopirellula maris]|uniref:Fluoride-specific ion channel FluC n=1 Tax=Pseudobythopirellula maris TaxID=2527991 RepID=A0A5C5ZU39_9BACT|nr:fluoride efflux transporter CrcB [Pseudobythopirellula maris]TWT90780.1 putative fluoride ion transporter CrcB [Pseudobythopirellula maris]
MYARIAAIALGGAFGALGRYGVGLACLRAFGDRFPYGTLAVNAIGCLVIGMLMHAGLVAAARLPTAAHAGLTVGLLGALTTFSTFGYETVRLLEQNQPLMALANVAANLLLGCAAVWVGLSLGRMVA